MFTETKIEHYFPDPEGTLETVCNMLKRAESGVSRVTLHRIETSCFEEHIVETAPGVCRISAGDTEGIRRGIYFLMDLLKTEKPSAFPVKTWHRVPWLKRRIARCHFGPIKRPPLNRDELMDEVDYYPEEYLNRLASEGINVLWLTVSFQDLCRTRFTPEAAPDRERRFAKLQRTIDRCRRFGIQIYLFCNEPEAWPFDAEAIKAHPQLGGPLLAGRRCFCPVHADGKEYLYECMKQIFSSVRHLGGMINISLGEGLTTCLSAYNGTAGGCGECHAEPGTILRSALESMRDGMRAAAPDAELIAWFYLPAAHALPEWIVRLFDDVPEGVIPQLNFESGVELEQLGRKRVGGDYWQSVSEPSENFVRFAGCRSGQGLEFSAKIQVGCSHEVATVPHVPVPALLYRKYAAMRRLGVTHVMQCWYFGCAPGIMNQAANLLAFTDFNQTSEQEFLLQLALPVWGRKFAPGVAEGWLKLSDAYSNYPLSNMFQYYGPAADGVRWNLYLKRCDRMLHPTWLLSRDYAGGDTLCECMENHTPEEIRILLRRLADGWNAGMRKFTALCAETSLSEEQRLEISLIEALGIQFETAWRIFRFYELRRELLDKNDRRVLNEMRTIVQKEIISRRRLIELCRQDSRLGFHPEAEGFKYDPELIGQSVEALEHLLHEFQQAENDPEGSCLRSISVPEEWYQIGKDKFISCGNFRWSAEMESSRLRILVENEEIVEGLDEFYIGIDDYGTHFPFLFHAASNARIYVLEPESQCRVERKENGWTLNLTIPLSSLPGKGENGLRINLIRLTRSYQKRCSWPPAKYTRNPRLNLIFYDPANMGGLSLQRENPFTTETREKCGSIFSLN